MISFCKCSRPNLPEGFVVFAEHQTAGRGQRGHRWESAPHRGLWFSILLRPQIPIVESARLTNWAAQAIAATIRQETGLEPAIKLPNDVYVEGRKVAGVLVETRAGQGSEWAAVAGIGVNVNQAPEEFPEELRERATSLAMALGRPDRLARHSPLPCSANWIERASSPSSIRTSPKPCHPEPRRRRRTSQLQVTFSPNEKPRIAIARSLAALRQLGMTKASASVRS